MDKKIDGLWVLCTVVYFFFFFLAGPYWIIWATNTLFRTKIQFTLQTWFASLMLLFMFGHTSPPKADTMKSKGNPNGE